MSKSPAFWEPYCHRSEAEFHLSNFAARVLGRHAGVVFFDGIDAARLKQAIPDAHGDTLDLVAAVVRPPLMPIEPAETLGALTLEQLSRERGQRIAARAPSARPSLPAQGAAHARRFIEAHKTAFDAAVGGETFGVLAGAVSVAAIVGGSIALAPVLGAAADAASLLLLAEDGSMLRYELKGDEVRKKKRETSWHCKLTETVGPLLVLADLAASGMRTLATPRHTSDAFKRASLDNPDRAARQTVMHAMQTETSSLAAGVRRAQQKMLAARRELLLLRTIEAPAHLASIYGAGVYGMDPPEAVSRSTDWLRQQKDEPPPVHPDHPAHLLIPQRPAVDGSSGAPAMQLHVAVGHRPRAAPAAPSAA